MEFRNEIKLPENEQLLKLNEEIYSISSGIL